MNLRDVQRLLAPVYRRALLTVARGFVLDVDDSTKTQELQLSILRDEVRSHLERLGAIGITCVPKNGATAAVLFIGGNRDHGLVLGLEDGSVRPKGLEPGETAVYDYAGSRIHLRSDGSVRIVPASGKVEIAGDLEVSGDVLDRAAGTGITMEEMRQRYDVHVHTDPQGGTTGPPTPLMEGL